MSELHELRCKECGKTWGNAPRSFCEDCFSPLEVSFDYDSLKKSLRREYLRERPFDMWRYAELLPFSGATTAGGSQRGAIGGTPLIVARKLGERLGSNNLYIKNDAVCFPSLS